MEQGVQNCVHRGQATLRTTLSLLILLFIFPFYGFGEKLISPESECGLYFLKERSQLGGEKIADLDPATFEEAIKNVPFHPHQSVLKVVGLRGSEAKANAVMLGQLQLALKKAGLPATAYKEVYRFEKLLEDQMGIFFEDGSGQVTKIAEVGDQQTLADILAKDTEGKFKDGQFVVSGSPILFYKKPAALEGYETKVVSKPKLLAETFLSHPGKVAAQPLKALRWFFPLKQDRTRPTKDEVRQSASKVVIPGFITYSVLQGVLDQPMQVILPLTVMNANASFFTGLARRTVNNWWARSKSIFPGVFSKNLVYSTLFAVPLYWSAAGSTEALSEALTVTGWTHMAASKWLSVLFTASWRSPFHTRINEWENERIKQSKTKMEEFDARNRGASIEKNISKYLMTPSFLYSLVSEDFLFRVVKDDHTYLNVVSQKMAETMAENPQIFMEFNSGHLMMGLFGASAYWLGNKSRVLDKLSSFALIVDKIELNIRHGISSPFKKILSMFKRSEK